LGECRPDTVPTEGWDGFESRPVRKSPKEIWGFFVQKILGECRQLQYSVYLRYCGSSETADVHEKRLTNWVPPEGHVWVLRITDTQYGKSKHYWGKYRDPKENLGPGAQLELF
jgi:CRISPR-associated protein Cas2